MWHTRQGQGVCSATVAYDGIVMVLEQHTPRAKQLCFGTFEESATMMRTPKSPALFSMSVWCPSLRFKRLAAVAWSGSSARLQGAVSTKLMAAICATVYTGVDS